MAQCSLGVLVPHWSPGTSPDGTKGTGHPSALHFGLVGHWPVPTGLRQLTVPYPYEWDGSCPHSRAMGLICPFLQPGQGMLLGQPKGRGMPLGWVLTDNGYPLQRKRPLQQQVYYMITACLCFCSTYVRVKQFIKADRSKVMALWAPAPQEQAELCWAERQWLHCAGLAVLLQHGEHPIASLPTQVLILSPAFKYIHDNWTQHHGRRYPSTGFTALLFALHTCQQVTTASGTTHCHCTSPALLVHMLAGHPSIHTATALAGICIGLRVRLWSRQ